MIPDLSSIPEVDGQLMAGDVLAEWCTIRTGRRRKSLKGILRTGEAISRTSACRRSLCRCVLSTPTPLRFQGAGGAYSGGKRNPGHGVRYGMGSVRVGGSPYLDYRGKVLAPEILPSMNDAKIVLNTMTWFKAGAHDQIFNGMLAKAVVVTDDSTYLRRRLPMAGNL